MADVLGWLLAAAVAVVLFWATQRPRTRGWVGLPMGGLWLSAFLAPAPLYSRVCDVLLMAYCGWLLHEWWNRTGRRERAARLVGYKARAALARLGVRTAHA